MFIGLPKDNFVNFLNVRKTGVAAAGNSNRNISYTYIDVSPGDNTINYYRLSETDKNGDKKIYRIIPVENCNASTSEHGNIYSYNNEV